MSETFGANESKLKKAKRVLREDGPAVPDQRQLGAGRGPHPADDEPEWRGIWLAPERCEFSLGHVGGALHPVGNGRPVLFGYGLDKMAQALVWHTMMERWTCIPRQRATMEWL